MIVSRKSIWKEVSIMNALKQAILNMVKLKEYDPKVGVPVPKIKVKEVLPVPPSK